MVNDLSDNLYKRHKVIRHSSKRLTKVEYEGKMNMQNVAETF